VVNRACPWCSERGTYCEHNALTLYVFEIDVIEIGVLLPIIRLLFRLFILRAALQPRLQTRLLALFIFIWYCEYTQLSQFDASLGVLFSKMRNLHNDLLITNSVVKLMGVNVLGAIVQIKLFGGFIPPNTNYYAEAIPTEIMPPGERS
jgi:hypothetical protein